MGREVGKSIHIQVLGLAVIAPDVFGRARTRDDRIHPAVLGALQASPEIKAALGDRIR